MPQLTPKSLAYLGGASDNSTRSKRRRAKRASALSDSKHTQSESVASSTTDQVPQLATEAVISYEYSLTRSGYPSATTDGAATKTVPVYDAQAIFGHSASATVVPWLLGLPINASSGAIDGDRIPPPSSTARYIGVVALPCTAELATQMHRLVTFASNV
ncbi:hypothetical protein GGH92_005192 [Coemansia sp. RSA 2673]|nr:hypothetical protein GGH92_005192 [Coemansia sp. RSA 2673]